MFGNIASSTCCCVGLHVDMLTDHPEKLSARGYLSSPVLTCGCPGTRFPGGASGRILPVYPSMYNGCGRP